MFPKVTATLASALALLNVDPGPSPRRRYLPDGSKPGGAFGTPGIGCLNPAQRQTFRRARVSGCVFPHEFIGR